MTNPNKGLQNIVEIEERLLPQDSEMIIIGTNRWVPEKCMWTVRKNLLRENIAIIFPFPELSASICHIFVGTSDRYNCFIHLTPLTSLFRQTTGELEKIRANLKELSGEIHDWHFSVYFFADNDHEMKFRNIISKVLGKKTVDFFAMRPKGYKQGEINLLYHMNKFYYSVQTLHAITAHRDASPIGSYNTFPIYAYE